MSLRLTISATENKNSFTVNDCTGSISKNFPGGWGGANLEIKNIETSTIIVTPPYLAPGSDPYRIDVTGNFPNINFYGYEVLPFQVGNQNNEIISGKWHIALEIKGKDKKGVSFTRAAFTNVVFTNNVECCIDKKQNIVGANAFKDEKQKKAIELNILLEKAKDARGCGRLNDASTIVEVLKAQCICSGC